MRRILVSVAALAMVPAVLVPAMASEPAASDVAVPTTGGERIEVAWTGIVAPGADDDSDCSGNATADAHEVTVAVPDGAYELVTASMRVTITPTGPNAPASDVLSLIHI